MISEMLGRAKAGVLPLSVFGALLFSATRTILSSRSLPSGVGKKDARSEGSREEKDGCRRTHRGAQAAAIRAADAAG